MSFIGTIKGFHWITKIVIALTAVLLALIIAGAIAQSYWMSNQGDQNAFNAGQGLGMMALALASILTQVFLLILVIIAIYMVAMSVKVWLEKYLNAMIAKLDLLAEQKTGHDATGATLSALNEKFARIEKKLDTIEGILEKVGEA
jgi:hypothetical protein